MDIKLKLTDENLGYLLEKIERCRSTTIQRMEIEHLKNILDDNQTMYQALKAIPPSQTVVTDCQECGIDDTEDDFVECEDSPTKNGQVFIENTGSIHIHL